MSKTPLILGTVGLLAAGALFFSVGPFQPAPTQAQDAAQNSELGELTPAEVRRIESWQRSHWQNTDFSKRAVSVSEILSGGPPPDGIPSIDAPTYIPVSEEGKLSPQEPVIALEINGKARAYPLAIMTWHEIVNDTFEGRDIAVTYCPLCNTSIVFDRVLDGETVEFGTSGNLRNSDLIMYDRKTFTWWQQFNGEGIIGAKTGEKLPVVPSRLMSWELFKQTYPDAEVLQQDTQNPRAYGRNPYVGYDTAARPFLFNGEFPEGINPMVRVVLIKEDGKEPLAVSLPHLRENGPVQFGDIEITWQAGQASALDTGQIAQGRDVGNVDVRREGALVAHEVTFAFTANAFFPGIEILGAQI